MGGLKPCPKCGKIPKLEYCCGEYFVAGDDPDCPGCGTAFTEMHSSPQMEIDAWNRRAKAPAADAVEVVRCKDCTKRETVLCAMETYDDFPWRASRDNDFCSYGERR